MKCCLKEMKLIERINLLPVDIYCNRVLKVFQCKNCLCFKYQLEELNQLNGNIIYDRNKPKKIKNIDAWIAALNSQKSYFNDKLIKVGNKSNMAFIYGKTKITPLGAIHEGYDFNGTKRKTFKPYSLSVF